MARIEKNVIEDDDARIRSEKLELVLRVGRCDKL